MGKVQWRSELLTQAGICVSYAAAFLAIHSIAAAHWHLYAGLQVICLLMVPYRYWGALLVGEAIPNAYEAWICLDTFGPTWVAIRSVPEILLTMPVIWWCRERLNVFPTRHLVNVKALLISVLLVSIVLSSYSYALISVLHITSGPFRPSPVMAAGYFFGNYVGLLTLVPWALIARMDYRKGRAKTQFSWMFSSRLAPDAFGIVIPMIIAMALVASRMGSAQAQLIEMAMFVPAGWLTAKHGWRAAALGGTTVIVCNALEPRHPRSGRHRDPSDPGTRGELPVRPWSSCNSSESAGRAGEAKDTGPAADGPPEPGHQRASAEGGRGASGVRCWLTSYRQQQGPRLHASYRAQH